MKKKGNQIAAGDVEALAAELREAASKEPRPVTMTARQLVARHIEDLSAMRRHGYTYAEITAIFKAHGLTLAPRTMKNYMSECMPPTLQRGGRHGFPTPMGNASKTNDAIEKHIVQQPSDASPRSKFAEYDNLANKPLE
jgi:hypothetical protein